MEVLKENRPALICPVARHCRGSQLCCSTKLPACALVSGRAILATGNFAPLSPTKGNSSDKEVGAVSRKLFYCPPQREHTSLALQPRVSVLQGVFVKGSLMVHICFI